MFIITPKISIIIPIYNRAHLIEETLDSILNQSYKNWECLIIDDKSTDNLKEVLQPYLANDARFNYAERSSEHIKGPSGCRNQGIDSSNGEYIIFFDSDDIVHPANLQICLSSIISGDYQFCRYDKKPFHGEWDDDFIFCKNDFETTRFNISDISKMITMELGFACCTVLWKKNSLNGLRFREELSYAEEWEFYTRLLSQGISGVSINKILYYNRKHPSSNTGQFWAKDPNMRISKLIAVKSVINTLAEKKLMTKPLINYFIRLSFFLKEKSILDEVFKKVHLGNWIKLKYTWGYRLYPLLKPFFKLKAKLKKS